MSKELLINSLPGHNIWVRLMSEDAEIRKRAQNEYLGWKQNSTTQEVLDAGLALLHKLIGSYNPDLSTGNNVPSTHALGQLQGLRDMLARMGEMNEEAEQLRTSVDSQLSPHDNFYDYDETD